MSDEIRISSHCGRKAAWDGFGMALLSGGDGAEEETHRAAGRSFEILTVLQTLSDQDRMTETDRRAHELFRDLARIDGLKLAGRDAVAQDHLDDRAHGLLVGAD